MISVVTCLEQFASVTLSTLATREGDTYMPTVADFDTREIRVLDQIPSGVSTERALQTWLRREGFLREKVCFGVRTSDGEFYIGTLSEGVFVFQSLTGEEGNKTFLPSECPSWWKVHPTEKETE